LAKDREGREKRGKGRKNDENGAENWEGMDVLIKP